MTYELIRSALETRLNALSPSVPIAWENAAFSPATSLFQRVNFLPARTENPTFGDDMHRESGIFQVSVYGAVGKGYAESLMRAELIRSWFPRGLSLVNGAVTVRILRTPSIAPAISDGEWFLIPVSVNYFCDVFQ